MADVTFLKYPDTHICRVLKNFVDAVNVDFWREIDRKQDSLTLTCFNLCDFKLTFEVQQFLPVFIEGRALWLD
jgi:hypothetical protein